MVNRVILVGNCGSEPETRFSQAGTAITNVSLATSNKYKKKDGEAVDETTWHKLIFFGRTAEVAGEYLHKGSQCFIEGRIQNRSYEDKQGVTKYVSEIIVDRLQLLGGKGERVDRSQADPVYDDNSELPF